MKYEEISSKFSKNDMIKSIGSELVLKYSGFLSLVGIGDEAKGYDSLNDELIVYSGGKFATVIEKGIDNEHIKQMKHNG